MPSKEFEIQIINHTLKGQSYEASDAKGVVVIVHGMGEYGKRYERTVVPMLIKESFAVFSSQASHSTNKSKLLHKDVTS